MEIDLITAEIDTIHQKVNLAFERKDMAIYMSQFDDGIRYTNADATVYDRKDLVYQTEKYFKKTKEISTTYYRIKSSLENQIFTEKIARKSVVFEKGLMFAKKKTVQTEEIFNWKKIDGNWKVTGIEVVLEEKY
ncbi:nuclear transport factor 2 family protein [Pedobacter sp. CFBP9032]|uniref:nuclear transport factor 2 family protein n=1 Tax=Pedobacter sp. CFBP9032 TaxID=3096539 RepID=UPI002A6A396D|nr:nuclear transport factor 2 family protein [Pedobacter sp. CFBP9032]MDY0903991.1 nuclear transport factor 2 family protein [Pedobacter sp. CFBP9032]